MAVSTLAGQSHHLEVHCNNRTRARAISHDMHSEPSNTIALAHVDLSSAIAIILHISRKDT